MQFYSDSYNDPGKLKAWSEFYTLPKRCRAKGMESSGQLLTVCQPFPKTFSIECGINMEY